MTWPPRWMACRSRPMCWNSKLRTANSGWSERYFVHNTSSPPRTQCSAHSFEIVLPVEAVVEGAAAQRPSGLPTTIKLTPTAPRGTTPSTSPFSPTRATRARFSSQYRCPTAASSLQSPGHAAGPNLSVLLPKSMTFAAGAGSEFSSSPEDPGFQTFVAKNALPARRWSSRSPATDRCRAKSRAGAASNGAEGRRRGQEARPRPAASPAAASATPSTRLTR